LIVAIREGSPAAKAGLAAIRKAPRGILSAIIVVGSLAFPPAIMLLPVANSLPIELGGDLIIAADGSLVRNCLDYQNEIRNAQPGEIVYLTCAPRGTKARPSPTSSDRKLLRRNSLGALSPAHFSFADHMTGLCR
jgi:S1-C subfamily serine protease